MGYLLDTCAVSDFVKGVGSTINTIASKDSLQIKISSITAYELLYGLQKNPQIKAKTKKAVLSFLNEIEILSFDIIETRIAADIRARLEAQGKLIGAYDILIGATALANNLTLVTSNEKEFSRIPELKIENWR